MSRSTNRHLFHSQPEGRQRRPTVDSIAATRSHTDATNDQENQTCQDNRTCGLVEATLLHYASRKRLPEDCVIMPERFLASRPDAIALGTYGPKRRRVYRRCDCSQLMSKKAWRKRGYRIIQGAEPVGHACYPYFGGHSRGICHYDLYADWQVVPSHRRDVPAPSQENR